MLYFRQRALEPNICPNLVMILWTHLQTLWNIEKSKPVGKTKLSPSHMQLNSYTKVCTIAHGMLCEFIRMTLAWYVMCYYNVV